MPTKKRSAKAALAKKSRKCGIEAPEVPEQVGNEAEALYDQESLDAVLSEAENIIFDFEVATKDEEVTDEQVDELISDMDYIRDRLEDFADEGWRDYRDTIEGFSNRLWLLGVAWPQFLPPWHVADIVDPADIGRKIRHAWIYEDDFLEIREMSDVCKLTFKEMVQKLVKDGRKKYSHSRKGS